MPVGGSRELVKAKRIEDRLEDADDETLVTVVLECGHPRLRATNDRVTALAHPLTVGFRDMRPLRKQSEAISEIDPARSNEMSIRARNSQAWIEPVEFDTHAAGGRLSQVPHLC